VTKFQRAVVPTIGETNRATRRWERLDEKRRKLEPGSAEWRKVVAEMRRCKEVMDARAEYGSAYYQEWKRLALGE
jgi:hypothetical protein